MHDGAQRLFAGFAFDKTLNNLVKQVPGAKWSLTRWIKIL